MSLQAKLDAFKASAALFLASDEASFVAGVELPVDGGMTAV
jgi:NAD(P)-dependent dehydrogenase (short-subunit alcohol dehydrogenase family)